MIGLLDKTLPPGAAPQATPQSHAQQPADAVCRRCTSWFFFTVCQTTWLVVVLAGVLCLVYARHLEGEYNDAYLVESKEFQRNMVRARSDLCVDTGKRAESGYDVNCSAWERYIEVPVDTRTWRALREREVAHYSFLSPLTADQFHLLADKVIDNWTLVMWCVLVFACSPVALLLCAPISTIGVRWCCCCSVERRVASAPRAAKSAPLDDGSDEVVKYTTPPNVFWVTQSQTHNNDVAWFQSRQMFGSSFATPGKKTS